jgi:hypothetical protein
MGMRAIGVLVIVVATAGCATRIDTIAVAPAREGEPIDVTVRVTPFLTFPQPPSLQVRSDTNATAYQPAGSLAPSGTNQYSGQIGPQPYGRNTLNVRVPYTIPLPPVTQSTSREQQFIVGARAACFAFDASDPTPQGWTVAGVFDNGNPATQVAGPGCNFGPGGSPGISGPPVRTQGANFPEIFPGNFGALAFPLGGSCFPTTLASGSPFWAFDFVSPDLSNRPEWQVSRLSFAIRSNDALLLPQSAWPRAQAIIRVRKPDNSISFFAEMVGSQFRFETVTSAWQRFTFSFSPPAGSTVLEARIRFFGTPAQRTSDSLVNLDLVCPE